MRTVLINTSGKELFFGYVPPHGATLAINDWYIVEEGLLRSVLGSGRNRYGRATELTALDNDEMRGDVFCFLTWEPQPSSSSSS